MNISVDNTDGTGDHENYLVKAEEVFELDGTEYRNCSKKAVHIRSRSRHEPWYGLSGIYSNIIFLFSKRSKFFLTSPIKHWHTAVHYKRSLSAEYG